MKRIKIWMAMTLILSMILGMQVCASDVQTDDKPIAVTITPSFDPEEVMVGDILEYKITVEKKSDNNVSDFRLSVYTETAFSDGDRCGQPHIEKDAANTAVKEYNNPNIASGVASVLFDNSKLEVKVPVTITVKVPVTWDMTWDKLILSSVAMVEQGDELSEVVSCQSGTIASPVYITMEPSTGIDVSKITAGQKLSFEVEVSNNSASPIENVYVAGYSSQTEDGMDFFGVFQTVNGVELQDNGRVAYIDSLAVGESVDLTLEGTLPSEYAEGSVDIWAQAFIMGSKEFTYGNILATDAHTVEGVIVTSQDKPDPNPQNPQNPQTPSQGQNNSQTASGTTNSGKTINAKPATANKAARTGDEAPIVLLFALLIASGAVFVFMKRKTA